MDNMKVKAICDEIKDRIENIHIGVFEDLTRDVFLISEQYPGVWLEHVYDSVIYARMFPERGREVARNTIEMFIDRQREDGQLPCYVRDSSKWKGNTKDVCGYSQIQECVSFGSLCLDVYEILGEDKEFLKKCRDSLEKWINWLENNRQTTNRGLIEMFCGFDTGHDNSARLDGLSCKGNYRVDNVTMDANILPPDDKAAPILAVDMNCNYYGNIASLAKMEEILGNSKAAKEQADKAEKVKQLMFRLLFDKGDCFFYDVDKDGSMRKCKSCTIFHLFMEKVLDKDADKELIDELISRHILNPDEFWTEYPFPSMAVNDKYFEKSTPNNCWGYFSQGLIALRATRWMDFYGLSGEFDVLAGKWLEAWTACYDVMKLGQELDPFTGEPSDCSQWYSSCMLFFYYSAKRLGIR